MRYRLVAVYNGFEQSRGEFAGACDAANEISLLLNGLEMVEGLAPMELRSLRLDILDAERQKREEE